MAENPYDEIDEDINEDEVFRSLYYENLEHQEGWARSNDEGWLYSDPEFDSDWEEEFGVCGFLDDPDLHTESENYWGHGRGKGSHLEHQLKTIYNGKQLQKYKLPICNSLRQVAKAMNISENELRFLTFSNAAATNYHYKHFYVLKKTRFLTSLSLIHLIQMARMLGKLPLLLHGLNKLEDCCRQISVPTFELKQAQRWIFENILKKLEPEIHDAAHGFRCSITQDGLKRSIVTNARPHIGAAVVVNFDLKDFFPSISYPRVKGLFKSLGYSKSASGIFALLCTVTFKNRQSYLPQGAPSSPAITNLICCRLDKRLVQIAEELGFVYTRYADDLTFSASSESLSRHCSLLQHTKSSLVARLFKETDSVVKYEGFRIKVLLGFW